MRAAFEVTQTLVGERALLAGHDRSDGGLLVALLEMAFAGNVGFDVALPEAAAAPLFAEELGLVLQVPETAGEAVCARYAAAGVRCTRIGAVVPGAAGPDARVRVRTTDGPPTLDEPLTALRDEWEATSFALERRQCAPECVQQELEGLQERVAPPYAATFPTPEIDLQRPAAPSDPKVAVVREEGSNGDREMVAALQLAGFEASDVTMQDLRTGATTLDAFRGVVFVGGFSYADTCGSAKGWAGGVLFDPTVRAQFDAFRARQDTFSLGVCNGCQLMSLLGWVGAAPGGGPGRTLLTHNASGRFESRFSTVRIEESPAVMLRGMAGSTLGVWVAHGEGRFQFAPGLEQELLAAGLAPIRYADDAGECTERYPFNPNGSPQGVASLCSPDGRHLALMPHPERSVLAWQWPWAPSSWPAAGASPWMQMFVNARDWCVEG